MLKSKVRTGSKQAYIRGDPPPRHHSLKGTISL
jgi:hypothetical protein